MSGGQHRDDEANGPSRSGEREAEGRRNRECNQLSAAALTSGCAQENKKLRQNVLDGADFVRDVLNTYPKKRALLRYCEGTSKCLVIRPRPRSMSDKSARPMDPWGSY